MSVQSRSDLGEILGACASPYGASAAEVVSEGMFGSAHEGLQRQCLSGLALTAVANVAQYDTNLYCKYGLLRLGQ